jgi:hypothetical protein
VDSLIAFGLFVRDRHAACYALEDRSRWFVLSPGHAPSDQLMDFWSVVELRRWAKA